MAMLAEKREKKVIRSYMLKAKPLDSDSCKVGQRLLEKMGWTPGKGLGVNEDGAPDPLRVKYKCDIRGLGFKDSERDALSCQEGFNELLTKLSQNRDNSVEPPGNDEEENELNSLELQSKKSRARVHYHKFTRGKDLSRATSKDLASILGFTSAKPSEGLVTCDDQPLHASVKKLGTSKDPNGSFNVGQTEEKENEVSSADISVPEYEFKKKNKKSKKNKGITRSYECSELCKEVDTASGRRKSVTWGDIEVSYVSKYISDLVDTSGESILDEDITPTSNSSVFKNVSSNDEKSEPLKRKKVRKTSPEKVVIEMDVTSELSGVDAPIPSVDEKKKHRKKKKDMESNQETLFMDTLGAMESNLTFKEKKETKKRKLDYFKEGIQSPVEGLDIMDSNKERSQSVNGDNEQKKRRKKEKQRHDNHPFEDREFTIPVDSIPETCSILYESSMNQVNDHELKGNGKPQKRKKRLQMLIDSSSTKDANVQNQSTVNPVNSTEIGLIRKKKDKKTKVKLRDDGQAHSNEESASCCIVEVTGSSNAPDDAGSDLFQCKRKTSKKNKKKDNKENKDQLQEITSPLKLSERNYDATDKEAKQKSKRKIDAVGQSEAPCKLSNEPSAPILSSLTKERMAKWKNRHRDVGSTVSTPALLVGQPNESKSSSGGADVRIRKKKKNSDDMQLDSINFVGTNLDSIKGYGCCAISV